MAIKFQVDALNATKSILDDEEYKERRKCNCRK